MRDLFNLFLVAVVIGFGGCTGVMAAFCAWPLIGERIGNLLTARVGEDRP